MEPFRIFFPLGLFCGIWGAFLWVVFGFELTANYPGTSHPDLMIGGFLFSFATGFLMTAIPKFTGTIPAQTWEWTLSFVLIIAMTFIDGMSLLYSDLRKYALVFVFLSVLFLIAFCFKRFIKKTHKPPPVFAFIGAGLFSGLFGSALLTLYEWQWVPDSVGLLAKGYFYHGMMLCLVLGVGSKLLPALMGWAVSPLQEIQSQVKQVKNIEVITTAVMAVVILSSFLVEVFFSLALGRGMRALVATIVGVLYWRLHKKPKTPGNLSKWLRISGIALIGGLWAYALWESYSIHAAHIIFVSGFSLLTLLIATRVTLSHGGHNMALEQTSPSLNWMAFLMLLAAIARVVAPFSQTTYALHLAFASIIWIFGVLIWAFVFIPKLKKTVVRA